MWFTAIQPYFKSGFNGLVKYQGTVIGTTGAGTNVGSNAFDGYVGANIGINYFESASPDGAWIGLDTGSNVQRRVQRIRYYPRPGYASRMRMRSLLANALTPIKGVV